MRSVRFRFKDGITEDRDIPAHIIDHRSTIVTSHPSWPVNIKRVKEPAFFLMGHRSSRKLSNNVGIRYRRVDSSHNQKVLLDEISTHYH